MAPQWLWQRRQHALFPGLEHVAGAAGLPLVCAAHLGRRGQRQLEVWEGSIHQRWGSGAPCQQRARPAQWTQQIAERYHSVRRNPTGMQEPPASSHTHLRQVDVLEERVGRAAVGCLAVVVVCTAWCGGRHGFHWLVKGDKGRLEGREGISMDWKQAHTRGSTPHTISPVCSSGMQYGTQFALA